ncbi:AraC family transcriptional regulator [Massilia endophytica]|uniref:AraC family transcriptional regulator n=1 Tax=Massilia endophytica TaxID=2899220 RepID=UPI001E2B4B3F|nr:AraC family transcriptional regulator [Massilia endophytica]UGQ46392.1 AraC family transcriptional regulator [Massilia endophytica]
MDLISSPAAGNHVEIAALDAGVILMEARFTDYAFERHSHDCYAIGVTGEGTQSFRCKGRRYDSRPGEFVLFNPDEDHDGDRGSSDGFRYQMLYLPEQFVRDCVDADAGLDASFYLQAPNLSDRRMARDFLRLARVLWTERYETLRAETLLREFIAGLLMQHGERPRPEAIPPKAVGMEKLARAKDYIRSNFWRELTVGELATVAGLSRAHLTRAFTAAFHTPPHVYLNAVRIAQAQRLIRNGMPLAAVAAECGFSDQSHFARRFKGSIGLAPSQWRQAVLART